MKNIQKIIKASLATAAFSALVFTLFFVTKYADAEITSQLSEGSTGSQVTELQVFLAKDSAVYPEGIVSGYFGSLTRAAVIRFQAKYGIAQVGEVGPVTSAKINALNGGVVSPVGDVYAPILSQVGATFDNSTNASATFSWVTDQPSTSKVYYSTNYPFLIYSAQSMTNANLVTSHSITVPGFQRGVQYYYMLESADNVGNYSVTLETPFKAQ
ncbi:MAG: hypothetical protein A3H57_01865 [Candidatus Taylorbacteria bacterium RIFCSPLOWO2_02_FULL_43_11]|nr:MAG: hypothetical protein A2743_00485 [Candidatus Taylorbacteria bacterium RIFCSPHIGHO2_01_FULL_43_47]OHA30935.1 MAG: hypothetical protein A3B08_04000 [Candidatus Taylorbacteria bacterium RIFCSPLOWO2_01_FULL_43_44]OHA37623.1 MAG: hypothetical protein A3H57_01865 [Candidatus Taylorbacteria bacterium RIFCSPLOWO2_02_FULL_43_11]